MVTASKGERPALTIAGSDPCGGAGIQGDLKTFAAHGVYGMAVITALTAQNTAEVTGVQVVPAEFVDQQLETLVRDVPWSAAKTGMLANEEILDVVCAFYERHKDLGHLVVDPVMVSSTGARLLSEDAVSFYRSRLMPLTAIVTPNHFEAEILAEMTINSPADQEKAAHVIYRAGARNVLVKGGDFQTENPVVSDYFFDGTEGYFLHHERHGQGSCHGTGCALSAAIAALLANGNSILESVEKARKYVLLGIRNSPQIGCGNPPICHGVVCS